MGDERCVVWLLLYGGLELNYNNMQYMGQYREDRNYSFIKMELMYNTGAICMGIELGL